MSAPTLADNLRELETNISELLLELARRNNQYARLRAAATEHADECDSGGTLRWTLRMLESEEPI